MTIERRGDAHRLRGDVILKGGARCSAADLSVLVPFAVERKSDRNSSPRVLGFKETFAGLQLRVVLFQALIDDARQLQLLECGIAVHVVVVRISVPAGCVPT